MSSVPKPDTLRDPAYRAWMMRQECCVNHIHSYERYGNEFLSDPAHVRTKRNHGDELMVPLCHAAHTEQHTVGIKTFAKKYRLNLTKLAESYRATYLEGL